MIQTAAPAAGAGVGEVGTARRTPTFAAAHNAFPGGCLLADGRVLLVFRQAPGHTTANGFGVIGSATSSDFGRTWSPSTVLLADPAADLRDPSITASAFGTRMWLTYFKATPTLAAAGVYVRASTDQGVTWGAEVRIDALPYAAICAPLLELDDGTLLATWYGRAGAETRDSVWVASSSDRGATWSTAARVADGTTDGRDYQEPVLVRSGATVKLLCRWGNNDSIAVLTSTSAGATWSAPVNAFPGWGRPSAAWLSTGLLVCVYRAQTTTREALARFSTDGGATWTQPELVDAATTQMTYAALVEVARGAVLTAVALEQTGASSTIAVRYILDGGGVSPIGDAIPARRTAVASRSGDQLLAWDDFDRPNGATLGVAPSGQAWTGGAVGVETATARPTTTGVQVALIDAAADVDVEADLSWATGSGCGLVVRAVDAGTCLYLTTETNGANLRLYKVTAGTAVQLAAVSTPSFATVDGQWHRYRLLCRGPKVVAYLDDQPAFTYTLTTAEQATFLAATRVGFRFNQTTSTAAHRARRLVVRR